MVVSRIQNYIKIRKSSLFYSINISEKASEIAFSIRWKMFRLQLGALENEWTKIKFLFAISTKCINLLQVKIASRQLKNIWVKKQLILSTINDNFSNNWVWITFLIILLGGNWKSESGSFFTVCSDFPFARGSFFADSLVACWWSGLIPEVLIQ